MTREEAIHHIMDVITENNTIAPNMVTFDLEKQALYMGIKALKQIKAIEGIIDVSNTTIQEDVLKYKMIVDVVKGE